MTTLRLLADDLTGALDSAAAFAGEVPVFLDAPPAEDDAAVSVVATATRDVPPADLPLLLALSVPWLRGAGVAFKKVDSLLRGNTFAECAWLAREGRFERLAFVPAFPQQGRFTRDGRAFVMQPGSSIELALGDCAIAESFAPFGDLPLWVPDARSDDDLRTIAARSLEASARRWLWCGSAGLAQAMAAVHGRAAQPGRVEASARPVMLVSASHHAVVRAQWLRLREAFPTGADLAFDLSPAQRLAPAAAAELLTRQTEEIVERQPRPATLIVVGGDTLRALCRASGARSLSAQPSVRAGWGRARLRGGRWDGVPVHSRSGAFGGPDDLAEMVAAVAAVFDEP